MKSETCKGDIYVLRLLEDTQEAAVKVAFDNDLVAENEVATYEPATLETIGELLDWRERDFVILDQ